MKGTGTVAAGMLGGRGAWSFLVSELRPGQVAFFTDRRGVTWKVYRYRRPSGRGLTAWVLGDYHWAPLGTARLALEGF